MHVCNQAIHTFTSNIFDIREVLQNQFRYAFRKGPHEIWAGAVITVLKAVMHVNTVNTVSDEISRGLFRKSYRNSFCKTSLSFEQRRFGLGCRSIYQVNVINVVTPTELGVKKFRQVTVKIKLIKMSWLGLGIKTTAFGPALLANFFLFFLFSLP